MWGNELGDGTMTNSKLAFAALAAITVASAPARAASWDAVADFSASNPNGVWSYGYGNASTFIAYGTTSLACYATGVTCHFDPTYNYSGVPSVSKNTTGGPIIYGSVSNFPHNVLNVHPGGDSSDPYGGTDLDSIVRFTAPTAGLYLFNARFTLLDDYSNSVGVYAGGSSSILTGPTGTSQAFGGSIALGAGGTIDFRTNRNGFYLYDSTGLSATVTNSVPEPASWALLIAGFGLTGGAMRRRRQHPVVAA